MNIIYNVNVHEHTHTHTQHGVCVLLPKIVDNFLRRDKHVEHSWFFPNIYFYMDNLGNRTNRCRAFFVPQIFSIINQFIV